MRIPTSEAAKRIATLYRRRLTTNWDEKEVNRFRQLVKSGWFDSLDDLALIERYYASERKKPAHGPDRGLHRRDLPTFLNQYPGEVDRAKDWAELHPIKPAPRKIIPLPPAKTEEAPVQVDPATLQKFHADFKASRGRELFGA